MSTTQSSNQRIDIRIDLETKQIAERAAAALGCSSLTEYITRLIKENSPKIIKKQTEIKLTNQQFDSFIKACLDTEAKPSKEILAAAKLLDTEGF
jgi:uncharacterized protein (DUF1778 family)